MKRQIGYGVGAALFVIAVLGMTKFLKIRSAIAEAAVRGQPPEAVTSAVVKEDEWPVELHAVGTLAPVNGAVLAAEELGRVKKISFDAGSKVQAGDVLVELDTSVEEAELAAAAAQKQLAQLALRRQEVLRSKNANSVADLDQARAAYRSEAAQVDRLQAVIARKRITAPFAGTAGRRLISEGQIIAVGTQVVSLQSFDPLFLNFSLPQQDLGHLASGTPVEFSVDTYPGEKFHGTVTAIDPHVDSNTRNVGIQATVSNGDQRLRPGMFVSANLVLPQRDRVLSIPASGVNFAPYGDTVFVIEKMHNGAEYLGARQQIVQLGRRRGDLVAVLAGVRAGEEIVSSGTFKLRPGAPVLVNNTVTPLADPTPTPADT